MLCVTQTMPDEWQEGEEGGGDVSPSPSPPHNSHPPSLPPGQTAEYRYGSSDEEDEEGEGSQEQLLVSVKYLLCFIIFLVCFLDGACIL